jgi:hypothetical protein
MWDTDSGTVDWALGVAATLDGPLLNNPTTMAVNFSVADGGTFSVFASEYPPMPQFVAGATLTLTATLADGTMATASTTVPGSQAPGLQVWITQPTPGATVSGAAAWATVWIDGTSGASNTLTATLDGRAAGSATSSSAGPISFTFDTTVVADGTHTLTVTARDAVGDTGTNGISIVIRNAR